MVKHPFRIMSCVLLLSLLLTVTGCGQQNQTIGSNQSSSLQKSATTEEETEQVSSPLEEGKDEVSKTEVESITKITLSIKEKTFTATLEENQAAEELAAMIQRAPVTLELTDYSGFEKVGPLGESLTTSDMQMTATAGDIVLYNGDQIVLFYGSNSWSYTKLAHVDDLSGWEDALGRGDVTITLSLGEE